MNKLTQSISWEQYVTPKMKSIEIKTEGVLCQSDYNFGGGGSYGDDDVNDNGSY